jgi:hypothetical protein
MVHPDFNSGPLQFGDTEAGKFYRQQIGISKIPREMKQVNLPYTQWSEVQPSKQRAGRK